MVGVQEFLIIKSGPKNLFFRYFFSGVLNNFLDVGNIHNIPIRSVISPGVIKRAAPNKIIAPSSRRSAGNLPSAISVFIASIVLKPCAFAR